MWTEDGKPDRPIANASLDDNVSTYLMRAAGNAAPGEERNRDPRSGAAVVITIVPRLVFLVNQRQFAAGLQTRSGAKESP